MMVRIMNKRWLQSQVTYQIYRQCAKISLWGKQSQESSLEVQVEGSPNSTGANVKRKKSLRPNHRDGRHIITHASASKLATWIQQHRRDPSAPVIHVEPGDGLVCGELLDQGVSSVVALPSTKIFSGDLLNLESKYGSDRFHVIPWHMLSLRLKLGTGQAAASYSQTETQVTHLLHGGKRSGSTYSVLHIGARAKNEHYEFVFYILRNIANPDPIISKPGVEFFFFAHPRFKSKLEFLATIEEADYSTRYSYMMVHVYLLYDIHFIGEFNADEFSPPFSKLRAVQDLEWVDPSKRLLVKLSLKKNMENLLPLDHHESFLVFLNQLYAKKAIRIVPTMEMLVPGCGLRMLALDFTMMDIILRARPERLLMLYKHMLMWPEYQLSPLKSYIELKTKGGANWLEDEKGDNL